MAFVKIGKILKNTSKRVHSSIELQAVGFLLRIKPLTFTLQGYCLSRKLSFYIFP